MRVLGWALRSVRSCACARLGLVNVCLVGAIFIRTYVHMCAHVCTHVLRCVWVWVGVPWCVWVWLWVRVLLWVGVGLGSVPGSGCGCGCVWVGGCQGRGWVPGWLGVDGCGSVWV